MASRTARLRPEGLRPLKDVAAGHLSADLLARVSQDGLDALPEAIRWRR